MSVPASLDTIVAIDQDARIHGWGDVWRLVKVTNKGPILRLVHDHATKLFLTHREYNTEALLPSFIYESEYFRPDSINERARKFEVTIAHLPQKDHADVIYKFSILQLFYKIHHQQKIPRTNAGFNRAAQMISEDLGVSKARPNFDVNDPRPAPKKRGSRNNVVAVVNGTTLRRLVEKIEEADWDLSELRDGRHASGNRSKRFSDETYQLLQRYSHEYCKLHRPTRVNVYGDFLIAFKALNDRLEAEGRDRDPTPSFSRLCLEIAGLDRFEVDLMRLGPDAAHRKWKFIGPGVEVTHALERVEMDFYKVDLQLLLADTVIWNSLPLNIRHQIERSRWYLCVALDAASRCVLGMRLSRSENARTAVETLRMVYQDKTDFARAAGALSPWDQRGPPMKVVTDQGSAFIDAFFKFRGASLLSDMFNPPAAQPQLRAFVERFFRTVLDSLLKRFEGNTGGSIKALGDYPAQLRAVLTIGQFSDLLIRWCVDIYHNMKHVGLGGETPRDAWLRLTRKMPPMPSPDPIRMRLSFGIDLSRPTRRTGIRILGLDYNSEELQAWCLKKGDSKVEVKLDPANIGEVSVRVDPKSLTWLAVPCRTRVMEGRRLDVWLLAAEELSRRFDTVAQMRLPVVHAAIEAIESSHRQAVYIAGLDVGEYDQNYIAHAERKLAIGFSVPASDTADGGWTTSGVAPTRAEPAGSLPSTYALPSCRSFAVGGSRIVAGRLQRPMKSVLPPEPESDPPDAEQHLGAESNSECPPKRSAAPETDSIRTASVPGAAETTGPRQRRTNVQMEK